MRKDEHVSQKDEKQMAQAVKWNNQEEDMASSGIC